MATSQIIYNDDVPGLAITISPSLPWSTFRSVTIVETPEEIIAAAANIHGWYIYNAATSVRYVKFWDIDTTPTIATDTAALKLTLAIPKGQAANVSFSSGIKFENGIYVAVTTGIADDDETAPTEGDITANIFYK